MSASGDPSTDWMEEFFFDTEFFVHHRGTPVLEHVMVPDCGWNMSVEERTLKSVLEEAHRHLEDCGK